jgi:hypothetical protein
MPDSTTYAQLVARHGHGRVADVVLARWSLDLEADHRWAALTDDLERMRVGIVGVPCPTCGVDVGTPCPVEVYGADRVPHVERIADAVRRGFV